jgi:membrane dipeptidase
MKNFLLPLLFLVTVEASAQNAEQIHQRAILIDTHNDALSNQLITGVDLGKEQTTGNFDLVRAKKGGLDAQVFSVWCSGQHGKNDAYAFANREIDSLYSLIKRYPSKIALVSDVAGLQKTLKQKKLAAMIGVEGGHMIEDNLDYVDSLAKRGMISYPDLEQ